MTNLDKSLLLRLLNQLRAECHNKIDDPDKSMEVDEALDGVQEAIEEA
jgi:hypothetical protein